MIVQAKDASNADFTIPDETPVDFSLDANGELYGNLVAPDGSQAKSLADITYGDARAGNVKYIANGEGPDSTVQVVITVNRSDDTSIKGIGSVVIEEQVIINVEVADKELEPLGSSDNKTNPNYNEDGPDKRTKIIDFSKVEKTTVTTKVTDNKNNPIPNYPFTIQALLHPNSGGHDHSANRPMGRFITPAGDTLTSFEGTTDENGNAMFTYLSSGIGGIDSLFVRGKTEEDTATAAIVLKIADFQLLDDGEHYDLTGAFGEPGVSSRHTVNHYGTANLVSKLKALADSVHADSSFVLRINDMSLKFGGPFDINNDWDTPHITHREGVSADVDDVDANGKTIRKKYLERWLKKPFLKGSLIDETNHFHVTIR